ncbi:hypothetical protein NW768_002478 [Fusarium equiseti]|uniref:F-box domain-containing protein n=1 Tax=Fusarium equiseti TaxID=61235 RepID=A0ABQ8RNU0_FUSEQ|nr:hypothetical protein NW768_002478 [Fusarium equiseti]
MDPSNNYPQGIHSLAITDSSSSSSRPLAQDNMSTMCLEELPYDVRHSILSSVDTVADLLIFVQASPVFYRDYAIEPERWLYHCLGLELGHGIIDAVTVHLAKTFTCRQDRTMDEVHRTMEDIRQFISSYHSCISSLTRPNSVLPNKADIISMVAFHLTVVMPLVSRFIEWTQSHFRALSLPDGLSHTEMKRIFRGFYRYQLFCNIFGPNEQTLQPWISADEKLEWFFSIFEPWETEEILCVYQFISDKYQKVRNEQWWYGTGILTDINQPGLSSLGLTFLLTLFKTDDQKTLSNLILQNTSRLYYAPWVAEAVTRACQVRRLNLVFSARDRAQAEREPMPFMGDNEDSPPLAWVTIWKGTYSNLFGQWIPRSFLRWGYVMWDSDRIVSTGAIAALEEKWVEACTIPSTDLFVDPRSRV